MIINAREKSLTLAELMLIERKHDQFNPADRYWKYESLAFLLKNLEAPTQVVEYLDDISHRINDDLTAEEAKAYRMNLLANGDRDSLPYQSHREVDKHRYDMIIDLTDKPRFHCMWKNHRVV